LLNNNPEERSSQEIYVLTLEGKMFLRNVCKLSSNAKRQELTGVYVQKFLKRRESFNSFLSVYEMWEADNA